MQNKGDKREKGWETQQILFAVTVVENNSQ